MTPTRRLPMLLNVAAGLVALLAIAVWPPARGPLLLLPLRHVPAGLPERGALAGGAALLARGPVPGSIIVVGDRARVAAQVASSGILILAAPRAGCTTSLETDTTA